MLQSCYSRDMSEKLAWAGRAMQLQEQSYLQDAIPPIRPGAWPASRPDDRQELSYELHCPRLGGCHAANGPAGKACVCSGGERGPLSRKPSALRKAALLLKINLAELSRAGLAGGLRLSKNCPHAGLSCATHRPSASSLLAHRPQPRDGPTALGAPFCYSRRGEERRTHGVVPLQVRRPLCARCQGLVGATAGSLQPYDLHLPVCHRLRARTWPSTTPTGSLRTWEEATPVR
jgi:hypothetical protein